MNRLSQKYMDVLLLNTRMEQPVTKEIMEIDNSNLKSRLVQLEAQANKYFHMKLQKDVMDKKISKLQVEMAIKEKNIRKLKSKTTKYHKDILEKSSSLKKMEHHLKKTWNLLLVLGNKLGKNDLLTGEEKDKLRIGYEEWFTLLVSQDKRKTEEVLNMLNDLPISLLEVLNDSNYCTTSKLNEAHFDADQNLIPSSSCYSSSILQTPKDNVSSIENSFSHTPNTELSSKYYNDDSSSTDAVVNSSFVTSCRLSIHEPINYHKIITSQSVSADDSKTHSDVSDHKSLKQNTNSCNISNKPCQYKPVTSLPNNLLKIVSNHSNLDLSGNLEDLPDTESYGINESQIAAYKLHVSEKIDDQEVSVNIAVPSNNKQTESTSSQMSLVENCILNAENINIIDTSAHCNLNSSNSIPKNNSVGSKNLMHNSKCDSTNNCPSKISHDTLIVNDNKTLKKRITTSKKIITQLSKKKLRKMVFGHGTCKNSDQGILPLERGNLPKSSSNQNNQSQNALKKEKSSDLHYNYESKVTHLPQNDSILKDHAKNKRTIMLPGPPMKISRKSKQCLAEKNYSELQDISYPLQQNLSSTNYVKRIQQSSSHSFQPKKKQKAILNKGTFDIAPVRVRGRTLVNNGTLRKENIEVENNVIDECNEELNKVDQTLRSESAVMEDKPMSECNFISTTKPKKIRKEHKKNLPKDKFEKIINKAGSTSCLKKENSTKKDTETDIQKNVSQKRVNSSKNVLNYLLKKAELSRAKKDVRIKNLPLVKLYKLKSKERNFTFNNISKYGTFKKGISRFHKHKSIAFITNINKPHYNDKEKALETKEESICDVNDAFDQAKGHSSETLKNNFPVIISKNETKKNINLQLNIAHEESSEITPENPNSDQMKSISVTVMAENTFMESEIPTSIENVNMSTIGRKSTQCAIKCDSGYITPLVAAKDLEESLKHVKSEENCISDNDSDIEGNLIIDEDLDNAENLISNKKQNISNEKCFSTCDSDSESHLVIDENFGVDEQCLISEEKLDKPQGKNSTIKRESNDDSSCTNVNVIKLTKSKVKKEHFPLVCTQNISNCINNCGTSTTDEGTKSKVISSSMNVKKEFVSSKNIPLSPSLQSVKVAVGDKYKPKDENHLNEPQNGSASENEDSNCSDNTFVLGTSVKSKFAGTGLNRKIAEKGAQRKRASIQSSASKKSSAKITQSLPEKFFQEFQNIEFTEENFKQNSKKLFNFLINPSHFPNNSALLFHVLNYLQVTKKNPLLSYSSNEDSSVLYPLDESCIVRTFFLIESKKKLHLDGILKTAVNTIHNLIISNKKFGIYGLAALCRVFTAICKEKEDSQKPVILCGHLLKMKHQFAPYLIASIASIWKEPFQIGSNLPAEEVLFHSCILYGTSKRPPKLVECNWESSIGIISKYFTALPVKDSKSAIHMLKDLIQVRCKDESWNNQYLSMALIILAGFEDWLWTKENLLTQYIIPNLNKYGRETLNENAFDLYCNMYVDALLLSPEHARLDSVLGKFFDSSTSQGNNFVRDSAALALVKFVNKKNRKLPSFLSSWLELNKENPKVKQIEPDCERLSLIES